MKIQLFVTKTDFSLPNLEKELNLLDLDYEILYIEDNPELVAALNIQHSPNILVNGKLAFRNQPSENELIAYIESIS